MPDYDVVVIGLGGMGSAAAAELARRGATVLGVERFGPAHDRGSSHGDTRIVRQAYLEHPDYVPLLRRAYQHWDALGLLNRTGALMIGASDSPVITGTLDSARRWGLPYEHLDRAAMAVRYPQFALQPGEEAVFEANAGHVSPENAVRAQLDRAAAAGAELRFETVADAWRPTPAGVEVTVDGAQVSAARLVLAAGAWTSGLLPASVSLPLRPVRRVQFFLRPDGGSAPFAPERFPVYIFQIAVGDMVYGFPAVTPDGDVKIGFHHRGADVDPDRLDRVVSAAEMSEMQRVVADRIPLLTGPVADARVCMYTMTPDEHFLLGPLPGYQDRVAIAAGFSGHGFKFTPVVGEVLADLALSGHTDLPIGFLSPARFA